MEAVLETQTLRITIDDAIGELTLIRPDVLNSIDEDLHHDLREALTLLAARTDLRVLVFVSTGRAFSAGGDTEFMRAVQQDFPRQLHMVEEGRLLMNQFVDFPVPIVMGVQGAAMGLASNLIGAADAAVASRNVKLADPHVRMGLVAGDGGCFVWPANVGTLRARRHLLTGDPLSAEDAYAFGMITDLVDEPDDVLPAARAIAARIAALPPLAVRGTKQALNRGLAHRAGEVFELSLQLERMSMATEDLLEATAAFKERRPGKFVGR